MRLFEIQGQNVMAYIQMFLQNFMYSWWGVEMTGSWVYNNKSAAYWFSSVLGMDDWLLEDRIPTMAMSNMNQQT